jgi:hypothetical protein
VNHWIFSRLVVSLCAAVEQHDLAIAASTTCMAQRSGFWSSRRDHTTCLARPESEVRGDRARPVPEHASTFSLKSRHCYFSFWSDRNFVSLPKEKPGPRAAGAVRGLGAPTKVDLLLTSHTSTRSGGISFFCCPLSSLSPNRALDPETNPSRRSSLPQISWSNSLLQLLSSSYGYHRRDCGHHAEL